MTDVILQLQMKSAGAISSRFQNCELFFDISRFLLLTLYARCVRNGVISLPEATSCDKNICAYTTTEYLALIESSPYYFLIIPC